MYRLGHEHRADQRTTTLRRTRQLAVGTTVTLAVALTLSACTANRAPSPAGGTASRSTSSAPTSTAGSGPAPSTSAAPVVAPAVISTVPLATTKLSPADRVSVAIKNGTLTAVRMTNPEGKAVAGALSADGSTWKSSEDLGYARTYRVVATGKDADGKPVTKQASYTTVAPSNQTMPYLQRIGGYPLGDQPTYGVAIVPVVHFDEHITDEAAAQRALTVTTTPHVDGAWSWIDDQNAHWRPQHYWPSGTKVTVAAKVYGLNLGSGLYGQSDASTSFTIGRRQLTIADDTAPASVNKVRVYNAAGQVIRTMNTSMGKHSGTYANGNYINYYTLDGAYTVLGHEQPAKMCSASYGLPANAVGGYPCENIYNATKISIGGIYLHYLPTTIYSQDHGADVSHGCLNMNSDNSLWFFQHSMVGDPVVIHGAKGAPKLQWFDGGDWSVPWSTWIKSSAVQ